MGLNEETVRQRIGEIKRIYKWTENSLANDSATQKRLNRQLSHDGTITLDTLLLILDACPEVSADWLLLGRGPMHLLSPDHPQNDDSRNPVPSEEQSSSPYSTSEQYNLRLLNLLEQKDRQIDRLISFLTK